MGAGGVAGDAIVWLVAGIAAATLVTMLVLRANARRREDRDPLTSLFDSAHFQARMEETAAFAERASVEMPAHGPRKTAVLSGKVDHVDHVGHVWGQETRADAIEQVAQVMRAGVRKTDFFAPSQDEGFTIVAEGASEIEASEIAKRLMEKLAKMPVPGVDEDLRLTASFGVAERREGESDSELRARADAALDTARDTRAGQGEDCIVAASEWEEVHFLPAPSPSENGPSDEDAGQTGSSEAA